MPVRFAIANGNWSATTTWDGGTLPQIGDDVYANGFTVTINQDINVNKISTALQSPAVAGGIFVIATTVNRTLTCNVESGTSTCLRIDDDNARTTIIGNIIGGSVANANGLFLNATTTNSLATQPIIYGNVIGGTASGAHGITARGDRPFFPTIYGNVIAGSVGNGILLSNAQPATTTTIYGNVTASGAIGCSAGGYIYIYGTVSASNAFYGAQCTLIIYVSGTMNNVAGYWAAYAPRMFVGTGGSMQFTLNEQTTNNNITLYSSNSFVGIPNTSDVRQGAVYGVSNNLTGTLKVPPASSVAVGVPVDNTVGTAIISITDMGALLASYNV
jgi:hypothetical protein